MMDSSISIHTDGNGTAAPPLSLKSCDSQLVTLRGKPAVATKQVDDNSLPLPIVDLARSQCSVLVQNHYPTSLEQLLFECFCVYPVEFNRPHWRH